MRERCIIFLKTHPRIIHLIWSVIRYFLRLSVKVSKQRNAILFCSFGGRNFNDSPKAIYDEICNREEFKDWYLVWAFVNPEEFKIPRGIKVKVDTFAFFKALVTSKIWISNSGMDRGVNLLTDKIIRVETWHGTPLKRIGGEENQNSFGFRPDDNKRAVDTSTIRCAQSEYDREIFVRVFHATQDSFLLSDLPRNDELLMYTTNRLKEIKIKLNIGNKKVILYTPTYREYLINTKRELFIAPPINLQKWQDKLGDNYVLLIRAHYAVSASLGICDNDFVKDVSKYTSLNDLYAISDMMISDYSSTYFDYSILERPMFCFAYDLEEYIEKRGVYLDMEKELPCRINRNEDELIDDILNRNFQDAVEAARKFRRKYAPYAGNASNVMVNAIVTHLKRNS